MSGFENQLLLASAGTGKTYRLTNQFLRLLLAGVEPERVLATSNLHVSPFFAQLLFSKRPEKHNVVVFQLALKQGELGNAHLTERLV